MGAVVAHGFLLGRRATHLPMTSPQRTTPPRPPTVLVVGSGFAGSTACGAWRSTCPRRRRAAAGQLGRLPALQPPAAQRGRRRGRAPPHRRRAARRPAPGQGAARPRGRRRRPGHTATLRRADGSSQELAWDRLVLAPGGVSRTFDIPGVAEHGLGLKTLAEATYLRDHVLRELERRRRRRPHRRRACCTFVVVGAGYPAPRSPPRCSWSPRGRPPTTRGCGPGPALGPGRPGPRVLPELDRRLGDDAMEVLRRRGVEVRLGTTVEEATADAVRLSDGETIPTHTLVWCTGVTPSPLIETLGLPTERGGCGSGPTSGCPAPLDVFAFGDAAAVPDLTRPSSPGRRPSTPSARARWPPATWPPRSGSARRSTTATGTSGSWSTWAASRRSPRRSGAASAGCRPGRDPRLPPARPAGGRQPHPGLARLAARLGHAAPAGPARLPPGGAGHHGRGRAHRHLPGPPADEWEAAARTSPPPGPWSPTTASPTGGARQPG